LIVEFTPDSDSFGCNSVRSFVDNLDYYQSFKQILHGGPRIDFSFTNDFTDRSILIVDVFEFQKNKKFKYQNTNIIVVETLRQLINLVDQNSFDLTKKYFIFSESYWNEKEYQWPGFDYKLIYTSWEIEDIKNRLANSSNLYHYVLDIDVPKQYNPKYDFLCLAGRGKRWRDVFINKLRSEVDLSNSLTSYFGKSLGNPSLLELDIPYSRDSKKFEDEFYCPIGDYKHKYVLSYFTRPELFVQSKFSIVVETEAENNEYHITEKTLKCLVVGHPFVVIGTPGYLNFIRDLGFVTCDHLFPEDYDKIINLEKRINAVVDLAKTLQISYNFYREDLITMQTHNLRNLFQLKNTPAYDKFLELFND
jgi:hypothetical protein